MSRGNLRSRTYVRMASRCFAGILMLGAAAFFAGCVEFSQFGQVSDREESWSISGVTIEQHQDDGSWKVLGQTDGKGRYNIFKNTIKGGGKIRLRKEGYATRVMHESQFLQEHSILLQPDGSSGANPDSDQNWIDPFK